MAQGLKTLDGFAEDPGSIPSTLIVACKTSETLVLEDLIPSSGLHDYQECSVVHRHICRKNIHTHNIGI